MVVIQNRNKESIFVVDDSEDNLYLMQFILEAQGYRVNLADNGRDAIKRIKECHPDLILLDIMMPQMDGYQVISQLQKNPSLSSIPVYLVTADKYVGCCEAIAAGADGLIYKPIEIDKLLSQVERTLGNNVDEQN